MTLVIDPLGDWENGQHITAIGRDLSRSSDGDVRALHERFAFDVDADGLIVPLASGPSVPEELRGVAGQRGLRKAIAQLRMDLTGGGDYIFGPVDGLYDALLDELPGIGLVGGYGRMYAGGITAPATGLVAVMGMTCRGFSEMAAHGQEFNTQRYFDSKPPSIEFVPDDALAWHDDIPMPMGSVRRRRMIEVRPRDNGVIDVEGYFRDTFLRPDGVELVVHEYGLGVTLTSDPLTVEHVAARPGNLPMEYCPLAALTAPRIEGLPLSEVEASVRRELRGPDGCTHLNDELRSLRMVRTLLEPVAS